MRRLAMLTLTSCLLGGLLWLTPGGRGDEPAAADSPPSGPVGVRIVDADDVADAIPEEFNDKGFDRYFNAAAFRDALVNQDAQSMTDLALQLAEGEKVLGRPHKAIKADKALTLAILFAQEKKDQELLKRLSKVITIRGDQVLAALVEKAMLASRKANPALVIGVDNTSPETFVLYKSFLEQIKLAKSIGDREGLDQLLKSVPLLTELTAAQREQLTKMIQEAMGGVAEKGDPDAEVLMKLANSGRGPAAPRFIALTYSARSNVLDKQQLAAFRAIRTGQQLLPFLTPDAVNKFRILTNSAHLGLAPILLALQKGTPQTVIVHGYRYQASWKFILVRLKNAMGTQAILTVVQSRALPVKSPMPKPK